MATLFRMHLSVVTMQGRVLVLLLLGSAVAIGVFAGLGARVQPFGYGDEVPSQDRVPSDGLAQPDASPPAPQSPADDGQNAQGNQTTEPGR